VAEQDDAVAEDPGAGQLPANSTIGAVAARSWSAIGQNAAISS